MSTNCQVKISSQHGAMGDDDYGADGVDVQCCKEFTGPSRRDRDPLKKLQDIERLDSGAPGVLKMERRHVEAALTCSRRAACRMPLIRRSAVDQEVAAMISFCLMGLALMMWGPGASGQARDEDRLLQEMGGGRRRPHHQPGRAVGLRQIDHTRRERPVHRTILAAPRSGSEHRGQRGQGGTLSAAPVRQRDVRCGQTGVADRPGALLHQVRQAGGDREPRGRPLHAQAVRRRRVHVRLPVRTLVLPAHRWHRR